MEFLDFFDEKEQVDGAGAISDDDGSPILLPSDGGLEISGTEGESEAKSSDGKSLTTRPGDDGDDQVGVLGGAR